jgi:hypothetical protein
VADRGRQASIERDPFRWRALSFHSSCLIVFTNPYDRLDQPTVVDTIHRSLQFRQDFKGTGWDSIRVNLVVPVR